ncbi:MAG: tRNA (N6-threonylcarbamoyladenosine(37)-N6)-methyltransferase TrmO [Clostridia bacterium]|nr:tRNA (N6-threonylcarbamoyladenosine(37)-N6)-methyltransferase TrmO [Clostridia bacterium]
MEIIARVESAYDEKFGIPRQSGLAGSSVERIVFEKNYRQMEAVRGIEGYSHLWILWLFSGIEPSSPEHFTATVRPPRLGGNERMGVFATRSPFRPNRIGLSCVRLLSVDRTGEEAPALIVSGGDMLNGTPVIDIKPYLPYTDAHPEALSGFADHSAGKLSVHFPPELLERIPEKKRQALLEALALDPRPGYQADRERVYGMMFAGMNIRFTVDREVLTVCSVGV